MWYIENHGEQSLGPQCTEGKWHRTKTFPLTSTYHCSKLPTIASRGWESPMPSPLAASYQQLTGETTFQWLPPILDHQLYPAGKVPGSKLRTPSVPFLSPLSSASHSSFGFRRKKQEAQEWAAWVLALGLLILWLFLPQCSCQGMSPEKCTVCCIPVAW